jgi:uncharacterized lipoprotein NlpE involved in copper resistance
MKLTALFIVVAMVCMTLEGCDSQTGYDSQVVMKELEGGLARANQAFIEGFADRPAQIVTIDYKPERPDHSRSPGDDVRP